MKLLLSLWQNLSFVVTMLTLVLSFREGMSQTRTADSLKLLLPGKVSVEKVDILYRLAYELVDVDNEVALMYARRAFEATNCEDSVRLVKTGRLKSLAFRRQNFMDSSLELSLKILPIARKISLRQELKFILNGLGNVYTEQARYDKALENYWESLELSKQDHNNFDISVAMNNIGIVYYKIYDYDNALKYLNDAIKLRRCSDRKYDLASILINAAIAYAHKGNLEQATSLVNEARAFCRRDCTKNVLMQASFTTGFIAFQKDNCHLAEKMFLESFVLSTEVGDERFQLDNIINLADIYISQRKYVLAEEYLQLANEKISVAGTSYNKEIMEVYLRLAFVHDKLKNHRKVAFYQSQYINLRDSIYSVELASSLMRIQAQNLERENQIKMKAQDDLLSLNNQIMLRQKYLNLTIGAVACLLLVLAVVLVKSNRQKEELNCLLDKRVKERTEALEINQTNLRRACEERDLILSRVVSEIKNAIATVKGLCSLARKDSTDANLYIDQVDNTSERFLRIVETLNYSRRLP